MARGTRGVARGARGTAARPPPPQAGRRKGARSAHGGEADAGMGARGGAGGARAAAARPSPPTRGAGPRGGRGRSAAARGRKRPRMDEWGDIFGCAMSGAAAVSTGPPWRRLGRRGVGGRSDTIRKALSSELDGIEMQSSEVDCHPLERSPSPLLEGGARCPVTSASTKAAGSGEMLATSALCQSDAVKNLGQGHTIDLEEPDYEKCQQSENTTLNKSERRNEHIGDPECSLKAQDVVPSYDGEVNCEEPSTQKESDIFDPSRNDPDAVRLIRSDYECLQPQKFVSPLVMRYLLRSVERKFEGCRDKFYIFDALFYEKLEKALFGVGDLSEMRGWCNNFNIFDRAYLIMPIHGENHWSLVVICIPGKESASGPIILHLDSLGCLSPHQKKDSLGSHPSTMILNIVERFLIEEWCHLMNNLDPNTSITKKKVEVPQLTNGFDTGIFMLYYIERFISQAPERFTKDYLCMFSKSWFKPEDAAELRHTLRLSLEEFMADTIRDDTVASDGEAVQLGNVGVDDLTALSTLEQNLKLSELRRNELLKELGQLNKSIALTRDQISKHPDMIQKKKDELVIGIKPL
ncbi:unnamed protein product [Urochloa humidicola]